MARTTREQSQDLDHPLVLSSRVVGMPVYDRAGTRLGHVDDLSIEKESGRTIYAILSFGGFLGIGEKFHPVPWPLLDYDVERGGFTVPLDPAELKNAPAYDDAAIRELGGADCNEEIYGYYSSYGAVPYW